MRCIGTCPVRREQQRGRGWSAECRWQKCKIKQSATRDMRARMTVFEDNTQQKMQPVRLGHAREKNKRTCEACAVQCTVYTSRRQQGSRHFLQAKLLVNNLILLVVLPLWRGPTKIAILSMPTRMRMKRTKCPNSITILELVFGEFDGSVKLDDHFPAHPSGAIFWLILPLDGCNGALRVQSKLPVIFVPFPLAPSGNVRSIFFCYLVQMSVSVFRPPKTTNWDSLHVWCLWNFSRIEFYLSLRTFRMHVLAWWYLRWSSVLPWRAPRHDSYLMTKYGMDNASNFSVVNRLVCSVGIKQLPQVQQTTDSATVFWTVRALGLWRNFARFEVLHVAQVANDFLRRVSFLQIFDECPLFWMNFASCALIFAFLAFARHLSRLLLVEYLGLWSQC